MGIENKKIMKKKRKEWRNYFGYMPSILCFLYYVVVCIVTGRLGGAQIVWPVIAAFLAMYTWLKHQVKAEATGRAGDEDTGGDGVPSSRGRTAKTEKLALRVLTAILVIGLACGAVIEGVILSAMVKEPVEHAEYVIVLGAKVNGTTPSLSLRYRIDSAAEYLKENPESIAIGSGGQGNDEAISEGLAIEKSLESNGIDPVRILIEDKSTSTEENLVFSGALIESMGDSLDSNIVIVTSDFHMFRALRLAKKLGYTNVSGLTSKTMWALVPQNHMREILAVGYYFVTGAL